MPRQGARASGTPSGKNKSDIEANESPSSAPPEVPLGSALFRVMRSVMFDDRPLPELEALPLAQFKLLWSVHHMRDATMKEFSERLRVSQSTVTQLAERLVRRGMVERLHDTTDRRVVRLRLSTLGHRLLSQAETRNKERHTAIWTELTAEQRADVMRGLETLYTIGEAWHAAQGTPLPPWPDRPGPPEEQTLSESETPRPVVDLMARRVRGTFT